MAYTVLSLVETFCALKGLGVPAAVVGSTEKSVTQYRALVDKLVLILSEYSWQSQRIRLAFLSQAGSDQGDLKADIFGAGYRSLVPDTLWNDDRVLQIKGPVPDQVWQRLQNLPHGGPEYLCWISGGHLYVSPDLENLENLSAVYQTGHGLLDTNGTTTKAVIAADSDTFLFPDLVVLTGLEFLWKRQKGEAGWEDTYNEFMSLINRNIVKDGAPVLSMDGPKLYPRPGIIVPAGSWNV